MRCDPTQARPTRRCKIKAVNPPFRSVSTPRSTKDFPEPRSVNPSGRLGNAGRSAAASEWDAEHLCERLRMELAFGAWKRLVRAAERRGATLEQLLDSGLSELA
jgi:hypothetical protein